jgi:type II secretion system protein I
MKADRGFTLLEVIVAMVIMSITFVTLITAASQSVDMASRSKFITTSTLLAQKRIADVMSDTAPRGPGTGEGDFGDDYRVYTYTEKTEMTPLEGCFKYTLTVKWGEKGNLETEFISFLSSK